jgi:TolB-like protein
VSFFDELHRRNVFRVAVAYVFAAWLVIQVVETILPSFGFGDAAIRTVTIVLAIGLVPVLVFSWVFEITPQGLKLERDIEHDGAPPSGGGRALDRILLIVMALALGYFAADKFLLEPARVARMMEETARQARAESLVESFGERSIAVLPFVNLSPDPGEEYFSDGISEDVLNLLAKIPGLRVISRSSAFRFRGGAVDIPSVARQLNVAHVLEGSVRRVGDEVRITAQLIDARSDSHLWSESYDRQLSARNVFAIQTQIAENIAAALNAVLSEPDLGRLQRIPTQSLEAYEAYLLGKQRMSVRSRAALLEAAAYFAEAVDLDPAYAPAHVGMADVRLLLTNYGYEPADTALPEVEKALATALSLDDRLGAAHASVGLSRMQRGDFDGAEAAFNSAIALDPNLATAYHWHGDMLVNAMARYEPAIPLLEKARALDPLSPIITVTLGEAYEGVGRFSEALALYHKALEIEPGFPAGYFLIGRYYWAVRGELDEAVRWLRKELAVDPDRDPSLLGTVYMDLGAFEEAAYWVRRSVDRWPDGFVPGSALVRLHRYLGEEREALMVARKLHSIAPGNNVTLVTLVNYGKYQEALETIAPLYPELDCSTDPEVRRNNLFQAINLSLALEKSGSTDCAGRLLDAVLAQIAVSPRLGWGGYGFLDAEVHARRGEIRQALYALRQGIDAGSRPGWYLQAEGSPHMTALIGLPEFQDMMAEVRSDLAAQRARVEEMEADGELARVP